MFARNVDVPAVVRDTDTRPAGDVLDDLLAAGPPVVFMANTVHPFMREMEEAVDAQAIETETPETVPEVR